MSLQDAFNASLGLVKLKTGIEPQIVLPTASRSSNYVVIEKFIPSNDNDAQASFRPLKVFRTIELANQYAELMAHKLERLTAARDANGQPLTPLDQLSQQFNVQDSEAEVEAFAPYAGTFEKTEIRTDEKDEGMKAWVVHWAHGTIFGTARLRVRERINRKMMIEPLKEADGVNQEWSRWLG